MRAEPVIRDVRWHERDKFLVSEEQQRVIREAVGVIFHVVALEQEDAILGARHELIPQASMLRLILHNLNHVHRKWWSGRTGRNFERTRRTCPAVRLSSRQRVTDHVRAVFALRAQEET